MTMARLTTIAAVLMLGLPAGCGGETASGTGATETDRASEADANIELREAVLSVPDMNCPMCPITVRKALTGVDGVSEADASLADKQATVVFDPGRASTEALIAAIADSGFSATLQESDNE